MSDAAPVVEAPVIEAPVVEAEAPEVEAPEVTDEELFELIVDGESKKVSKEELKKMASHGQGAAKRMQEATKLKNDALRILDLIRENPLKARKELDSEFDEKSFLSKRLAELMEEEMMTPLERAHAAEIAELNAYRKEKTQREQEAQDRELDELTKTRQGELDVEIGNALTSVGLPKSRSAVTRLGTYMMEAIENGLDIPTEKLAAQVKIDIETDIRELLGQADDDSFEKLLGGDLITKAQKAQLKKLKTPGDRVAPTVVDKAPKKVEFDHEAAKAMRRKHGFI